MPPAPPPLEMCPRSPKGYPLTTNNHYNPVTVSDNGVLLYQSGGDTGGKNQLAWYDRGGKLLGTVLESGGVYRPRDLSRWKVGGVSAGRKLTE